MKQTFQILTFLAIASSVQAQNYTSYNLLLEKYVKEKGVNYRLWAASAEDTSELSNILKEWSKVNSAGLNKKDRAAFRINLYNAVMLDTVLNHYPIKSVTKIGSAFSIFKKNIISTPKGKISLDTLEKKQLLKDFPDARVHFAVNCASVSCPPLRNEAFTGKDLEKQLNDQAKRFANSPHAYQYKNKTALYSELFNWYAKDFGTTHPATYLNQFRNKKLSLSNSKGWIKYDWNLNSSN